MEKVPGLTEEEKEQLVKNQMAALDALKNLKKETDELPHPQHYQVTYGLLERQCKEYQTAG